MQQPYRVIAIVCSLALAGFVIDLIRRGRIKEELWAAWIVIALAPLATSIWISPWASLARWLGFGYEPALLLILGLFFCIFLILYSSTIISRLMWQNQRLAQEIAYLTWRVDRLAEASSARDESRSRADQTSA